MSELIGIARFRFHPGKVEEYKRLSAEAMDIVRAREPDTLEYSIFFNADETEAVVIERFASSEALLQHGANMSQRCSPRRRWRASSWVSRTTSFERC
jgi:quinol monooxygenase YgiN